MDSPVASFTDQGLEETFDAPAEEAKQFIPEFIGEPPVTVREISNIDVSGDTATAEVDVAFGKIVELTRDSLIKEGGV